MTSKTSGFTSVTGLALCGSLLLGTFAGAFWLTGWAGGPEREVSGYATSLAGRTKNQRRNAWLAARQLDGAVIRPGDVFTFNGRVKGWSQDDGYVKAPVSFDGELIRAYGGGVCQTSTTLYNAALLAGLPILERHPHQFRPAYATPGRDAAVAYPGVDLRFKNPYEYPLRIEAKAEGDILKIRILGAVPAPKLVRIESDILSVSRPERRIYRVQGGGRVKRNALRSPGLPGCRAVAYRLWLEKGEVVRREKLSDDTYATMNRVVGLAG